jgi:hypothetical protein
MWRSVLLFGIGFVIVLALTPANWIAEDSDDDPFLPSRHNRHESEPY